MPPEIQKIIADAKDPKKRAALEKLYSDTSEFLTESAAETKTSEALIVELERSVARSRRQRAKNARARRGITEELVLLAL